MTNKIYREGCTFTWESFSFTLTTEERRIYLWKMEVISGNPQQLHESTKSRFFLGEGDLDSNGLIFGTWDIHSIICWFCREKRVWSDRNRSYCEEYQSCFGNGNSEIQKPLRRRILERKAINMHFKKEVFQPRVHFELHPKGINNAWSSFDKQRRVSSQGRETRPNIFFCRTREWRRIGDFKND